MKLIKLNNNYYDQLSEMIDEWNKDINDNHGNSSPYAIFRNDYHDFKYYLNNLEHDEPKYGLVPDSVFFLYDEDKDKLIGAVNIRHYLNDYLLQYGGHVGDGIRPSERNKGYGTMLIRLALDECKKLGIDRVLFVCDKDNIASKSTIINNGGVLENEIIDENGNILERYWIEL